MSKNTYLAMLAAPRATSSRFGEIVYPYFDEFSFAATILSTNPMTEMTAEVVNCKRRTEGKTKRFSYRLQDGSLSGGWGEGGRRTRLTVLVKCFSVDALIGNPITPRSPPPRPSIFPRTSSPSLSHPKREVKTEKGSKAGTHQGSFPSLSLSLSLSCPLPPDYHPP